MTPDPNRQHLQSVQTLSYSASRQRGLVGKDENRRHRSVRAGVDVPWLGAVVAYRLRVQEPKGQLIRMLCHGVGAGSQVDFAWVKEGEKDVVNGLGL